MNKNIDDILRELVTIEPSFAQYEGEMRTLISELLAKKPDTRLDEQFVTRLRAQLIGRPTPSSFSRYFSYLPYAVAALAVLIALPYGAQFVRSGSGSPVFAMNQQIQSLGSDAYGTLAPQQSEQGGLGGNGVAHGAFSAASAQNETTAAPAPTMATAPAAGSAVPAADTAAATPAVAKVATSYATTNSARIAFPPGPMTVYNYVYKGDPLDLSATGDVYSRVTGQNSSAQVASQLKKFNFGLINLSAFSDTSVRTFELAENKPYGYLIDASFVDGTISINADYTQWPSLNGKNSDVQPLSMSAMLKDDELIGIAKQFLNAYGVNLSNYADPVVQQYSEGVASDSGTQMAPDQITVVYPLKISGIQVYEDGASPYGLQVGISIRDKKVMSVYGLTSQTYTSSSYKLETDSDKILSVLKKGGPNSWIPPEDSDVQTKNVDIEIGTPTKVLMHTYNYTNGASQELFVPALMFPVTSTPSDGGHYPKSILVPLIPELLNQAQTGPIPYNALR